jgi:protocatechuate 3,4-dioxygenase beta subunit
MTFVLAALAVAHLATAPQARPTSPAAPAPQGAVAGTGQISGTVKVAADDAPVSRARVVAVSPALPEPRVTITNAEGKYTIADLPAGSYTLTVTRTGYAAYTYGQGRAITGTPVTLTNGQKTGNIDFPLVAGGVIVGRILDEDGAPFAGALVEALVLRFQAGNDMLFSVASAQTDDRGDFRLHGLAPGTYYVSASDPAFESVSTPKGVLNYTPTYYPGTTMADEAKTVTIGGPTPAPRVEFRLQLVPPATIEGLLVPYDAKPLLNGAIILSPLGGQGVPMVAPEEPQVFPDGRFAFVGVAPGRYQIRARGQTDTVMPALFAVYSIEVFGVDVDGIRLTLRPGAILDGTLTVERVKGNDPPPLSSLRVRAPFIDGNAFGDSLSGTVQPGGTFALRGIMKGAHQIVVDGLQAPWVVKSVRYRGRDITDLQLTVEEREQFRDVQIVITDAGSEVSGVVHNARGLPAADTGVIVCARAPVFWMRTNRRMRVTHTDAQGRWSIAGLPPGEYFAVASTLVDESDLRRRDRLTSLASLGTPFSVESDEARPTVSLKVNTLIPNASR